MIGAEDGYLRRRGILAPEECARWARRVYAARSDWTPCFDAVQFTLGRAFYTHLEEGAADEYFAAARASDALVESALPGMQARVRAAVSALIGAPVFPRLGWCGPGVHIFPARGWLAEHGGDIHFDTEGLRAEELAARAPALSFILMLQPPEREGGLRVWGAVYEDAAADDDDGASARAAGAPSLLIDYTAGDLVALDSYRLHQIQPFAGDRDRISITAHVVFSHGRWQIWF